MNTSVKQETAFQHDIQRTIVYIIQRPHRVMWIIHHQWATQAITVLRPHVRMIPERLRLIGNNELVLERIARRDRAPANERRTIRPNRAPLEQTVPVLQRLMSLQSIDGWKGRTMDVLRSTESSTRRLTTLIRNRSPCANAMS
jgi:hypothetical protein